MEADGPRSEHDEVKTSDARTHERGNVSFPYSDLASAIEVARAVFSRVGRGICDLDELAAELGQTMSGSFRLRTGAARLFGFTEKVGRASVKLTSLGLRVASEESEAEAKVEAFLAVELYQAIFSRYRGVNLPAARALEREMVTLGVPEKVADRARHAFARSARQAGYFDSGENRLVRPKVQGAIAQKSEESTILGDREPTAHEEIKPEKMARGLHPFVEGLLRTLPEPESAWSAPDRVKWLRTAAGIFDLIYNGSDRQIAVTLAETERF